MALITQNLVTNSHSRISLYFTTLHLKTPKFSLSFPSTNSSPHFEILKTQSVISPCKLISFRRAHHSGHLKAFESDGAIDKQYLADSFNFDAFLSVAEFCCLASSAVISIGFAINSTFSSSQRPVFEWLGSKASVWQFLLLVGGIVIGAAIRRRQWRRICVDLSKPGSGVNLVERVEKLEEDLRSSATIIRVLSRQLEKLGIRFRVTRKAMKEPIAEAAALAQKNSEATRALAVQEDILEKELGEIQKVLLAMQEQQQKQLELILAIGKAGKLWESKRVTNQDQSKSETSNAAVDGIKQMTNNENQVLAREMEASNDSFAI